jgi:hypothetical protein
MLLTCEVAMARWRVEVQTVSFMSLSSALSYEAARSRTGFFLPSALASKIR